jgi:hypothetical protein
MAFAPKPGLILIPDISGYTEFLNEVELTHASHVVAELLRTLLGDTRLNLTLSDIEGDGLLFYRLGAPPSFEQLSDQAERWMGGFHRKLRLLERDAFCSCGACSAVGKLRLKVVGHYGEIGVHRIGRLTKLIGKDVVLAHRLLKNTVPLSEYLYLSWPLYDACGRPEDEYVRIVPRQEQYPVFNTIHTALLDLSGVRAELPPPPPRGEVPPQQAQVYGETFARCGVEEAAALLGDLTCQPEWLDGLTEIWLDPSEPLRAGHHHVCVVGGRRIDQYLHDVVRGDGTFRIAFFIRPPRPLLKSLYALLEARDAEGRVRLGMTLAFTPRLGMGALARRLLEPGLRRLLERSLLNLKNRLERESGRAAFQARTGRETPQAAVNGS